MSKLFAITRQLTGTPYIHHAYVYDGNKVVMACTHRHGERGISGQKTAADCAVRMLLKVQRRRERELLESP